MHVMTDCIVTTQEGKPQMCFTLMFSNHEKKNSNAQNY